MARTTRPTYDPHTIGDQRPLVAILADTQTGCYAPPAPRTTTPPAPLARNWDTATVLSYLSEQPAILPSAQRVEVIGAWVWVWFSARPAVEVRDALRAAGFHWNQTRGCWQHTGGKRTRHTTADAGYLRSKYGFVTIADEAA